MNAKSLWCDLDPAGSLLFNDVWNKTPAEASVYLVGTGPVFSGHWWATPGNVSDLVDRYIADLVEGS